jgi:hypothetical protein
VKTGAERRRYERITAPPMVVRNGDAVVVDVSEGGLCLELRKPGGDPGAYYLTLTDGLFCLGQDLRAEVRWTHERQVGLEWTNLNPDARVFLRNCFRRWTEERIPIWVEVYAS